jgi:Protein of unknown function (DUF4238)
LRGYGGEVMAKRARHHHFVPKALQRHFCENRRNFWFTTKGSDGRYLKPEWRNIDSTFQRHDFYTILDSSGIPTDEVERNFYEFLDNHLGTLLNEIHDILDRGQIPAFEGEVLESLQNLFVPLVNRTPHSLSGRDHDDVAVGEVFARNVIVGLTERNPHDPELPKFHKMLTNKGELAAQGRTIRVKATTSRYPLIERQLRDFSARVAVSEGKHSFVLHSAMIHRIGNGGPNGLSNPKCELLFPISSKRALVLVRDPVGRIPPICSVSVSQMRSINLNAFSQGCDLASSSEALLSSLIS